jgi:hypothetical protein
MAKCAAKNRYGQQCGANATPNGKCAIHQRGDAARDLARRGVERRQTTAKESRARAAVLISNGSEDVEKALAAVFSDLLIGEIDASTARAAACVALAMLKAREVAQWKSGCRSHNLKTKLILLISPLKNGKRIPTSSSRGLSQSSSPAEIGP